jgi:hypothetical protein
MKIVDRIRLFGMISIIVLLLVYLNLRSAHGANVPLLQLITMLTGCAISLAGMIAIYILDKQNRKTR